MIWFLSSKFRRQVYQILRPLNGEILPQTAAFIQKYEDSGETIYVLSSTLHTSVAFAAGHSVHLKAATKFVLVQKMSSEVWKCSEHSIRGRKAAN